MELMTNLAIFALNPEKGTTLIHDNKSKLNISVQKLSQNFST